MIPVTKPYLPCREALNKYIDGIYERNWLTNNGPLVQELTKRLESYLGVENLLLVSNGTLALQIAYRALGIHEPVNGKRAEAITTPFTFVATASSLEWEGIKPVFVDIDKETWCLNPKNLPSAITSQTKAIVPVHVFGNACEVEKIQAVAEQYQLKVIYDAAHAFGVQYKDRSLLTWGDAATLSFHATKVFHTVEGGAIIFKQKEDLERARSFINFGLTAPDEIGGVGINAKMNEFQAAMGLCVLDEIETNLSSRQQRWNLYEEKLKNSFQLQKCNPQASNNYAYIPIVLESEGRLIEVLDYLKSKNIFARRYFHPSLDELNCFGISEPCPVSRDVSRRILCFPIYASLSLHDLENILNGWF